MAKRNRKSTPAKQQASATSPVVVQHVDQSITVRSVDRSRKTLDSWKQALTAAESVYQPTRKLLYDLYAYAMLDEHLQSVVGKRRLALTNSSLVFHIDGIEVDAIQDLIKRRFFRQLIRHILDSRLYGFSLIMADFNARKTQLVPRPHVVPSRALVVSEPYATIGIDYTAPEYQDYYAPVGETDDLGLLISAVPLVMVKVGDVSDWATFNELFGQPLRKGTYNPLDPGAKVQLETALTAMGSAAHIAVPDGTNVEFIESNRTGAKDTYQGLADFMDKGMSKLIVGQTMTTDAEGGQYKGEVHERVADAIAKDDQEFVLGYLNEVVREMLIAQGFPAQEGEFKFIEEESRISKKDRLTMDIEIHTKVGKLKKEYFQEEYNIVFVDDSDETPETNPEETDQDDPGQDDPDQDEPDKDQKNGLGADTLARLNSFSELWQEVRSFFAKAPTR